jgi:hypothetical protein
MILKIVFVTILLCNFSFASFQKLRIGHIDSYYKNKISKYELRNLIDEVEYILESKLDINVFDYTSSGKPINLVYVTPSRLEKRISSYLNKLNEKEKEIKRLTKSFPKEQVKIKKLKKMFSEQNNLLNKRVKLLNDYVLTVNKKKRMSKIEYNDLKRYVKREKSKLQVEITKLKKEESYIKRVVNSFNNKMSTYNNLILEHKRLNAQLEVMSRGFKKVKGMTFGIKEIRFKTFYKDGKKVKERSVKNIMNKIDIYGFKNIDELKTILAHEILHLVGIPHINVKNALMHPVLQKKQLEEVNLTEEDISNFNENF